MITNKEAARLWHKNLGILEEWFADYHKRTGTSLEDLNAERRSHAYHDERATVVDTVRGYEVSMCPLGDGRTYRFTAVAPWSIWTVVGLGDFEGPDVDAAIRDLNEIVDEFERLTAEGGR